MLTYLQYLPASIDKIEKPKKGIGKYVSHRSYYEAKVSKGFKKQNNFTLN